MLRSENKDLLQDKLAQFFANINDEAGKKQVFFVIRTFLNLNNMENRTPEELAKEAQEVKQEILSRIEAVEDEI